MSAEAEAELDSGIWALPPLVLEKIFQNLALEGKKTARRVCQLWRQILDDPAKLYYTFRALVLTVPDYKALIESYRTIEVVHFGGVAAALSPTKFPAIQSAVLRSNVQWESIVEFLTKACQNVNTLTIDHYGFEKVDLTQMSLITSDNLWQKLCSLKLNLENLHFGRGKLHAGAIEIFLKSVKFPQLSELSISILDEDAAEETISLVTEVYNFIGRHSDKLQTLEIVLGSILFAQSDMVYNHTLLRKPSMVVNISKITQIPNLRSLCVENCFNMQDSQLQWDDNLKSLKIVAYGPQNAFWFSFLHDMTACFTRFDKFKQIECFKLCTPTWVYNVAKIQEILALTDFKEVLFWTSSNENMNQIRTYCASIPDLIFSNKKSQFDNITGWETTIKKDPDFS